MCHNTLTPARLGLYHDILTPARTPRLWLCHDTLTPAKTPRLWLYHDTLTPARTPKLHEGVVMRCIYMWGLSWAVSQHTDTRKAWVVS